MRQEDLREYFDRNRLAETQKREIFNSVIEKTDEAFTGRGAYSKRRIILLVTALMLLLSCVAYGIVKSESDPLNDISYWRDGRRVEQTIVITEEGYKVLIGEAGSTLKVNRGYFNKAKPFMIRMTVTADKKSEIPFVILDEERYREMKPKCKELEIEPLSYLIVAAYTVDPEDLDAMVEDITEYYDANGEFGEKGHEMIEEKYGI